MQRLKFARARHARFAEHGRVLHLVERFDIEPFSEPNHQTLEGSFSAVSTPNFATKASFSAFFEIYKICNPWHCSDPKNSAKNCKIFADFRMVRMVRSFADRTFQLSGLEGESADECRDGVHEAERGDNVTLATVQQKLT